jgi:hypothetical protein
MADRSPILAARIMGPALLIFGAALLSGRVNIAELVSTLVAEPASRLFAAAVSVILGLVLWSAPRYVF